jgi:hypothetical protein
MHVDTIKPFIRLLISSYNIRILIVCHYSPENFCGKRIDPKNNLDSGRMQRHAAKVLADLTLRASGWSGMGPDLAQSRLMI